MFEFIGQSLKSAVNKLKFVDDEKALKNALETLKNSLLKADVYHKVIKEHEVSRKDLEKYVLDKLVHSISSNK